MRVESLVLRCQTRDALEGGEFALYCMSARDGAIRRPSDQAQRGGRRVRERHGVTVRSVSGSSQRPAW